MHPSPCFNNYGFKANLVSPTSSPPAHFAADLTYVILSVNMSACISKGWVLFNQKTTIPLSQLKKIILCYHHIINVNNQISSVFKFLIFSCFLWMHVLTVYNHLQEHPIVWMLCSHPHVSFNKFLCILVNCSLNLETWSDSVSIWWW